MLNALHSLGKQNLLDLARHCETAVSPGAPTVYAIQQLVGAKAAQSVNQCIRGLTSSGWTIQQTGTLCRSIHDARTTAEPDQSIDLVLSGPEVFGTPTRDTRAVMHSLLAEAVNEVLLVGYVIHNASSLFAPLAQRMAVEHGLKVWVCLDIPRTWNDTTSAHELLRRFSHEFRTRHWPWEPRPKVYYDPRSLEPSGPTRSSLHAKCLVVDRKVALVTSANFTEAAQERNIECGIVIRNDKLVARLTRYFDGLLDLNHLKDSEI
jgi:hypothetical protein